MKKFKRTLYWLPAMILCLSGCNTEELVDTNAAHEGEKTVIHLSLKSPDMKVYSRASLSDTDEKKITSLCVYIFDSNTGALLGNTIHENAGAHASDKDPDKDGVISPDGSNYIAIETLTGNNRDIYVIANYHSCTIENLKGVSTIDDVKQLIARTFGNPLSRDYGMVMVGTLYKQPVRANENITVELEQMSAKITVKVINKCADLDITGWTVDGIPLKSYVFERSVGEDPNYHDASNIIDAHDYYYDFSDQCFPFEQDPASSADGSYNSTFYMLENRRGGRVEDRQEPPPTEDTREPYQLKAWYAPDNASRIRILGKLKGSQTSSICINHYLGANNTDDYNINRSTHYTYTITINSMNSIKIDTNIESKEVSLDITPAADLMNMDAHYDCRSFSLNTSLITEENVKVSAEVLQSINSDINPAWLNLAVFSSSAQSVKSAESDISQWQQDGTNNTYVRPKFIPNKAVRDLLTGAGTDFTGSGLVKDDAVDNYPTDDTSLPYSKAAHRMCKKITDIPTGSNGQSVPVNLYIYAHEYDFDAAATAPSYREAVVRFTVQKGSEAPQYTHFTVRQYPPYRFAEISVGGSNYMLVTERMEEYEHFSQAQLPMSLQMLTGMQWGPYQSIGTTMGDGYTNTLQGVYTGTSSADYYKTYLDKYGSKASGWSTANDGKIIEGPGATPTSTSAYNTIYNSTAARYCHEKNRDINGDGQIDGSETSWYLPSEQEMQLLWTYHEAINLYPDYYWSSTTADSDYAYAFSMQNSPASPHQTYNGVPQPISKTTALLGPKFPRVRCVRRVAVPAGTNNVSAIRPIVSHRVDGTTVIDCSNLPNNMYTADTKMNINSADVGSIQYANRQVYKRFEIQRKENAVTDFNSLRQGNGKCDSSKGWRLPTQREMLMVYSVKSLLESNSGFEAFKSTGGSANYWTMTCDMSAQYIIDFSTGLCQYGNYFDATNKFYYRCVREIK